MPGAALAFKHDYDEVPVSATTEVLEANVAALRDSLNEFKTEVRSDIGNMNGEIKSLRDEIKSVREDLRDEIKSLREKTDRGFERLFTRFDLGIKETNQALSELSRTVLKLDGGRAAIVWVGGGLIALITLAITVGKAFKWF